MGTDPEWKKQYPEFETKCLVYLCITPVKVWRDAVMIEWTREKKRKLLNSGILNTEALAEIEASEEPFLQIAAEFENLVNAEKAFNTAKEQGVVDIYLYAGGILYDKFD